MVYDFPLYLGLVRVTERGMRGFGVGGGDHEFGVAIIFPMVC